MGTAYTEMPTPLYGASNFLTVPGPQSFQRRVPSDVFATSNMRSASMETLAALEPSSPLTPPGSRQSPRSSVLLKAHSVGSDLGSRAVSTNRQFSNTSLPRTVSQEAPSPARTSFQPQYSSQNFIHRADENGKAAGKPDSEAGPKNGATQQSRGGRCGQFKWCQYCGLLVFLAVLGLVGYGVYEGITSSSSGEDDVAISDENKDGCACPTSPPSHVTVSPAVCDINLSELLRELEAPDSGDPSLKCEREGIHPHPSKCDAFYSCNSSRAIVKVGRCPPGCLFHPDYNEKCIHQKSGYYQDPWNCTMFHRCVDPLVGESTLRSEGPHSCQESDNMGFSTHVPGPAPQCLPQQEVPGCDSSSNPPSG